MVGNQPGFFLGFDKEEDCTYKGIIHDTLILPNGTYFQDYFYNTTKAVLQDLSYTLASHDQKCLDIVEVFTTLIVRFVSEELGGLSLKANNNPDGKHTEDELTLMLEDMYSNVFVDIEAQHVFRVAKDAKANAETLLEEIKGSYQAANGLGGIIERISELFNKRAGASFPFLRRLHKTGKPIDQLINAVLAAIVASFEYIPALVTIVYFYLDPKNVEHRTRITELANSEDPQADKVILGYVREALRLEPLFASTRRTVLRNVSVGTSNLQAGDVVKLHTSHANLDENTFPEPQRVDPSRAASSYTLMGDGLHKCFTKEFVQSTMTSSIRAVFQLKNVSLGPGQSGVLHRFKDAHDSTSEFRFLNPRSVITPFPTRLTLQYDV